VGGEHAEHGAGAGRSPRQPGRGLLELGPPHLAEVLHRREHQVVLGQEVVQLGAAADPGALGDERRRRTAPAVLLQAVDRRVEEPLPHQAGALLLRHARGDGHLRILGASTTNSRACLLLSSGRASGPMSMT